MIDKPVSSALPVRSPRKRAAFIFVTMIAFIAILEVSARAYWWLSFDVSPLRPGDALYFFYPEMRAAHTMPLPENPRTTKVLLLAGSVLHPTWSSFARRLAFRMEDALGSPVVVSNLAMPAHSSLDSLNKFRLLADHRYDLVVVYHGINDARANNCPQQVFRDDYTHYSWYRFIDAFLRHENSARWTALPMTASVAGLELSELLSPPDLIPYGDPRQDWIEFGAEVKTAGPFRRNISEILRIAAHREVPVLLTTFATYLPADYSLERFKAKKLDYSSHKSPVEIWGLPSNIQAAVNIHNQAIREVAKMDGRVGFVDQALLMPADGEYFDDVCHLTESGTERFIENMLPKAVELVGNRRDLNSD